MTSHHQNHHSWIARLFARLVTDSRPAPEARGVTYPDYLTCPHCGEPEVEVWGCDGPISCHNCGRVFTCAQARAAEEALGR
jgi:transcription elongation factor Elf1